MSQRKNYYKKHNEFTPVESTSEEFIEETPVEDTVIDEAPVVEEPKTVFVTVANCVALNVREKASLDANVLEVVNVGTSLEVIGRKKDFVEVKCPSGRTGFVMKKFTE